MLDRKKLNVVPTTPPDSDDDLEKAMRKAKEILNDPLIVAVRGKTPEELNRIARGLLGNVFGSDQS